MNIERISIPESNLFSKVVNDYVLKKEQLLPFIEQFPNNSNFEEHIKRKLRQYNHRKLLTEVLKEQYSSEKEIEALGTNIELLSEENTLSVTTAHQPIIFTGPLYFIYKAIHAIKLSAHYTKLFPLYNFVPVFYIGSEDHDLDEIGSVYVKGKRYTWQTSEEGACGEMKTENLIPLLHELKQQLPNASVSLHELLDIFEDAYKTRDTLADATRTILHALLGNLGLVVFDANNKKCKEAFLPVLHDELFKQSSEPLVQETSKNLEQFYPAHAATGRPINLFYKLPGMRSRIEFIDNKFEVHGSNIQFNLSEIKQELEKYPERFSPNVILRPLLQETLLPNIAFVGGGGELAYWLQLKKVFSYHHVVYPILYLRQSLIWLHAPVVKKWHSLQLPITQILIPPQQLQRNLVKENVLFTSVQEEVKKLDTHWQQIQESASHVSPTLVESMKAHQAKHKKITQRIQDKFLSHLSRKRNDLLNKLLFIHQSIFPDNSLQERKINLMEMMHEGHDEFIKQCVEIIEANATDVLIISE